MRDLGIMIRLLLLSLSLIISSWSGALAQSRDIYTVRGLDVDEMAETVIEAQAAAFSDAKLQGLEKMIARVTLPEDLIGRDPLQIGPELADRLAAAVDVEEEVRGAGRSRARLAVVFNPTLFRSYMQSIGLPFSDRAAPPALLVPIARDNYRYAWSAAWDETSEGRLAPTVTSRNRSLSYLSGWADFRDEVEMTGTARAVTAELIGSPGRFQAQLSIVTASGVEQVGLTGFYSTTKRTAAAAADLLDVAWKRRSIIRETSRNEIEVTVLYTSLPEWNRLRQALAASPAIIEFTTKSIAKDGAVVSFVFAGDGQQLLSDLRDRGVSIQSEDIGWVVSTTAFGPQTETE